MSLIKLPGLIDIHVHLRDPGQTEKEDFYTGTSAALAGGFTTVLDMPNNNDPIFTSTKLKEKKEIAGKKTVCDIGFYFGSQGNNSDQFKLVSDNVFGLKLYLNMTTGKYLVESDKVEEIYNAWPGSRPILLHAEEETLTQIINIIKKTGKRTHICHVSSKNELETIIAAKQMGVPITCGVTAHHLFLTEEDTKKIGAFADMKPPLKSKSDQEYLWKNLSQIDVIESDHAPHTLEEKKSDNPPFGVPGLETTLPLLLSAVSQNKMKIEDIVRLCFDNPKKIFSIPTSEDTYVEVDPNEKYTITASQMKSKCGWTPFEGMEVKGRVKRVVIRGKTAYYNRNIVVEKGFGKVL